MKMTINANNLSKDNFKKICRTCLMEGDLKPLFDSCKKEECIVEMLMACTLVQFKKDDRFPEQICTNCIKEINQSFKFAKQCELVDEALKKCLGIDEKETVNVNNKETKQQKNNKSKSNTNVKKIKKKPGRPKTKDTAPKLVKNEDNDMQVEDLNVKQEDTEYTLVKAEDINIQNEDYITDENITESYVVIENDNDVKKESEDEIWTNDYSEEIEDKSEKRMTRRQTRRSAKRSESIESFEKDMEDENLDNQEENHYDDEDGNWSDDFEWNMDDNSDKEGHHQTRRRRVSRGPPFICKRCDISYETMDELEKHRIKVKHPERKTQPCPQCNKFFTSSQLKGHIRTHTKERPFLCSHCGKGFSLNQNLRRHLMIHTGERPHKCHLCEKAFIQQVSLKDHLKTHTGETPYVCSVCGCGFKWQGQLKKHMLARHEEAADSLLKKEGEIKSTDLEHECPICHRRYNKKAILRTHMLIHGEKKFLCSWCGKGFFSIASLQAHSKVHTGIRPYTCQVCGKTFSHIGSLKSHTLIHTGEKPFSCSVCNKAFTQRNHVKYHMRIHTGDRPYMCTVCGKTFALNGNLTVHMRTHTGETPFVCPICGKGFHDSSSMKKHKKGHSGQPSTAALTTANATIAVPETAAAVVVAAASTTTVVLQTNESLTMQQLHANESAIIHQNEQIVVLQADPLTGMQ